MSRLSEFAVSKRSVTLLLAGALFIAGFLAWGNLKQELLPDIEFPVITVIAPLPGAGAADVAEQVTKPIERAISGVPRLESLQSTSANSLALVVAQFSFGIGRQGGPCGHRAEPPDRRAAAECHPAGHRPEHQLLAGDHRVDRSHSQDGLADAAAIAQDEIRPALLGIEGVGSVDVTGGEEQRVLITLYPDKLTENGVSHRPGDRRPGGQQPDLPVGPDHDARGRRSRSPRSAASERSTTSRTWWSASRLPPAPPARCSPRPAPLRRRLRRHRAPAVSPPAPVQVTIGDLGTVEVVGVATPATRAPTAKPSRCRCPSRRPRTPTPSRWPTTVTAKLNELGRAAHGRRDDHGRLRPVHRSSRNPETACSGRVAWAPCSRS